MILQILPILVVPLQIIFNNVLEEVLSWIYGTVLTHAFKIKATWSVHVCTCMQQAQRVPVVPVLSGQTPSDTRSGTTRKIRYAHRTN